MLDFEFEFKFWREGVTYVLRACTLRLLFVLWKMNVIVGILRSKSKSKSNAPTTDDDDDDDIDIKRCGDAAGETTTSKRSQQVKYFCWKKSET